MLFVLGLCAGLAVGVVLMIWLNFQDERSG